MNENLSKEDWSWVHKKYPRKVRVLLEFEQESDFCEIDALKGTGLGEAILNIVGETFGLVNATTLKVPDSDRTVRITRLSKRTGSNESGKMNGRMCGSFGDHDPFP